MTKSFYETLKDISEILAKGTVDFNHPNLERFIADNDGLPSWDNQSFADDVKIFVDTTPLPAPEIHSLGLWTIPLIISRQAKCLMYLKNPGSAGKSSGVAYLCVLQAQRLQWVFPVFVGKGNNACNPDFLPGISVMFVTAEALKPLASHGSVAYTTACLWGNTASGLASTYSGKCSVDVQEQLKPFIPVSTEIGVSDTTFFSELNLGYPGLEEVKNNVVAGNIAQAKIEYVKYLVHKFGKSQNWPDVHFNKTVNIEEADDICNNIFIFQAHMYRRYEYGNKIDWSLIVDDDIESRVWMNAHPWMWTLINAYTATQNEKYITSFCRIFNSWYTTSPMTFSRTNAQWRTLEAGGRAGQKWTVALLSLAEHPVFQRECLFNMAKSMVDHGKYLSMYASPGSNWLQVESSGLLTTALLFPELLLSPLFLDTAMNRLIEINSRLFLPDGFQSECSTGYHRFPLMGIASALRLAVHTHTALPQSLLNQYENGVEVFKHIVYPDGTLPFLNDNSPNRQRIGELFDTGAEVFNRPDFRWMGSNGKTGSPPEGLSHDFTHAGYCVMRDKWGAEAQMLIFDAGNFGTGHQHEDKLNFVLYAGGREVIGDPGIYSYNHNEYEPYWRGTWSHNSVVIDGLSQHRALGPNEDIPDPDRRYVYNTEFDYAVGWYRRAYSPRGAQVWENKTHTREEDIASSIRDVQHQRCVVYLKSRYAVVFDRIVGTGTHGVEIIFRPAPVLEDDKKGKKTVRAVKLETFPGDVVVTQEDKCSNVAIIPVHTDGQEKAVNYVFRNIIGQKKPIRGWYAWLGIQPSHEIVYGYKTPLPMHAETIIQPLSAGKNVVEKTQGIKVGTTGENTCAGIIYGKDLILLSYSSPCVMKYNNVEFNGTVLVLTYSDKKFDTPAAAYMVDGIELIINGKKVYSGGKVGEIKTVVLK
ncbi:MAG: alginate lyase family protein [Elusimicrobiota bacterium]